MRKILSAVIVLGLLLALQAGAAAGDLENNRLIEAAKSGNVGDVRALLDQGADVNAKDNNGDTALMKAADKGKTEVVGVLLDRGADVNAKNNNGETAVMWVDNADVVRILIDRGAEVNAKDKYGKTALMNAARFSTAAVVKALIDKGADVNAKDDTDYSVLMRANARGNADIIQLLKDAQAKAVSPNSRGFEGDWVVSGYREGDALTLRYDGTVVRIRKDGEVMLLDGPTTFEFGTRFIQSGNKLEGSFMPTFAQMKEYYPTMSDRVLRQAVASGQMVYNIILTMGEDGRIYVERDNYDLFWTHNAFTTNFDHAVKYPGWYSYTLRRSGK